MTSRINVIRPAVANRLGEPCQTVTESDTLCRTKVIRRGFHALRISLHRTRECSEANPPCQNRYTVSRLELAALTSSERLRLDWPDTSQRQGGRIAERVVHTLRLEHPVRKQPTFRLVRVMDRQMKATPGSTGDLRTGLRAFPERDASLQSLQSTWCHEHPLIAQFPSHRACTRPISATCVEPLARHACTEGDTSCPRGRQLAVAGITDLEWWIGLAPNPPAVTTQPPHPKVGCPDCSGKTRADLLSHVHELKLHNHWRFYHNRLFTERLGGLPTARAPSTRDAPNVTASMTPKRLPPIKPENTHPCWRLGEVRSDDTEPWFSRLGTASDTRSRTTCVR